MEYQWDAADDLSAYVKLLVSCNNAGRKSRDGKREIKSSLCVCGGSICNRFDASLSKVNFQGYVKANSSNRDRFNVTGLAKLEKERDLFSCGLPKETKNYTRA